MLWSGRLTFMCTRILVVDSRFSRDLTVWDTCTCCVAQDTDSFLFIDPQCGLAVLSTRWPIEVLWALNLEAQIKPLIWYVVYPMISVLWCKVCFQCQFKINWKSVDYSLHIILIWCNLVKSVDKKLYLTLGINISSYNSIYTCMYFFFF